MGPYDVYGNIEEERSASSRLPFGLGGDGVAAWLPEVALFAAGSLAYRYGIKTGVPGASGLKYTPQQAAAAKAVARAVKSGGSYHEVNTRIRTAMFKSRVSMSTTRIAGPSLTLQERMKGHTKKKGKGNPKKDWWGPKKSVSTTRRVPAVQFGGRNSTKFPVTSAYAKSTMRSMWAGTARGAKIAQTGKAMLGWATGLGMMQLGAMAIDIGTSIGEGAIDWRPRRDGAGPVQFGDTYSEIMGAYTQRQRAIMAIHDSQLTTRAAIGNEASFLHG